MRATMAPEPRPTPCAAAPTSARGPPAELVDQRRERRGARDGDRREDSVNEQRPGAYVGGEMGNGLGSIVDRHSWRRGASEWVNVDLSVGEDGNPTRVDAGEQPILVVRYGETVVALDETCAHAGAPLSEGKIVDGQIESPLHGSRCELSTGYRSGADDVRPAPVHATADERWGCEAQLAKPPR